jgi:hypothetical protein
MPNDQRVEIPTVCRDTLYSSDQGLFYTCSSMCLQLMPAYEDLEWVEDTERNTCLIHTICIFGKNYRARQLLYNDCELVYNFIIYMTIMSIPIYCLHSHSFKLWVAFTEGLWPILSRRFDIVAISRGNLENGGVENSKQKSHAMLLRRLSILQWSKAYTYTCPNSPYYH